MFRRITEGLKGGILRVASIAEVAARLLLLVGGAPGCGRACPALGGLLAVAGSCCETASARLPLCAKSWWLLLALVCLWASGFCGAGPGLWDSPSESGAAFLLRVVGVPALCPVHLSVPVHNNCALALAAAASSTA